MKILEAQSATLTNFEVYKHLKEIQTKPRTGGRRPGNLDNVVKELLQYLEEAPSPFAEKPCPYNDETIRTLLERLRPYNLTKAEVLMILNHRPTNLENLNTIIEEMEFRISDDDQWAVVEIVKEVLGCHDQEEMRQTMTDNAQKARTDQEERMRQDMEEKDG
ncbi:hypothetical protein CJF31_00009734 [Rutstroemia sp. NJR-2017a BVV2]|nr:hypothetical protein CJF31_00009734 [Rutstroemia sp. NJR-2017a BVV2]